MTNKQRMIKHEEEQKMFRAFNYLRVTFRNFGFEVQYYEHEAMNLIRRLNYAHGRAKKICRTRQKEGRI